MAFADAVFDGQATLDGVPAVRADELEHVRQALAQRESIPVYVRPWGPVLATPEHRVLVDARMRKHAAAEVQIGYADLTVGLGPSLVAGRHADVIVETSWGGPGAVLTEGASLPLAGEPREIAGHARDRYIYAPVEGVLRTKAQIGDGVRQGQEVAEIGAMVVTAPLDGILRGLTHDDVPVTVGTKIIEVDPRRRVSEVRGMVERPRRIAEGVLSAIREYDSARVMRRHRSTTERRI